MSKCLQRESRIKLRPLVKQIKVEGSVQTDLVINMPIVVKALNARLGSKGRVTNRFIGTGTLYAVQFDDGCVGYFNRSELEILEPEEKHDNIDESKGFHDVIELLTRP